MTNKSNTNYTDGERVLDYITNPANYDTGYRFCWSGNHSWDEECALSLPQIKAMIDGARNKTKFIWWNNRTSDFCFYDCVEVECFGLDEDYELKIDSIEAWDKLQADRPDAGSAQAIIKLEVDAMFDWIEMMGWDDDRVNAACAAAEKMFYLK